MAFLKAKLEVNEAETTNYLHNLQNPCKTDFLVLSVISLVLQKSAY